MRSTTPFKYALLCVAVLFVSLTAIAQDYSITTTGGNLVVTDLSGNGEGITLETSGTNLQVRCSNTTRTYSVDGNPNVTFGTYFLIPFTNVNSITINMEGGNDDITVYGFTTQLPSLTINGGVGDDQVTFLGDITFLNGANLNVDLQNDDATPGTDHVWIYSNVDLLLQGTGQATIKVSKYVSFFQYATLRTANGDITIEANQQTISTTGFGYSGVFMNTQSIVECTGTGNVTVKGKGGDLYSPIEGDHGVHLYLSAKIIGGTAGTDLLVEGTGGSYSSSNYGVYVNRGQVTSNGGDVQVNGTGGAGASGYNYGVYIYNTGGLISSGGNGNISINGTGGTAGNGSNNLGVYLSNSASIAPGGDGDISIIGTGGGTGTSSYNYGVIASSANGITTSGAGDITVQGTGGQGTGVYHYGVYVTATNGIQSTGSGNVSVTGTGGGTGASTNCIGVYSSSTTAISATGTGHLTVNGTGGSGTGLQQIGVYAYGSNAISRSGSGNLTVTGIGGTASTSYDNHGVHANGSNSINTTGSGNISVTGIGGGTGTSYQSYGVYVQAGYGISTTGVGTIDVDGTGGAGSGSSNHGVNLAHSVVSSGGGDISVTGTAGSNSTAAFDVYLISNGSVSGTSTGSDITFECTSEGLNPFNYNTDVSTGSSNTISFVSGSKINFEIDGTTVNSNYRQLHIDGQINLTGSTPTFIGSSYIPTTGNSFTLIDNDGTDPVIGTFTGLPQGATLTNFLGSGLDATISYTGGDGNDVTINMPADYQIDVLGGNLTITDLSGNSDPLYLQQSGTNIRIYGPSSARTYRINDGSNTSFGIYADIPFTSVTNSITVNAEGGNDGVIVYAFTQQLPSLTINGGTGNDYVQFQGDVTFAAGANLDVDLQNDDANPGIDYIRITGSTDILLQGSGSATFKASRDVFFYTYATLKTANGNITVETNQQTTPTTGYYFSGVTLDDYSVIESTGTGVVTIKGRGGNLANSSIPGSGIYMQLNSKIIGGTTGVSTVVDGTGGSATAYTNVGVQIEGGQISSNGGDVEVTGTGGSGLANNSYGVFVYNTGALISAGGDGNISVEGVGDGTSGYNYGVYISGGTAKIGATGNGDVVVTGTGGGASTGMRNYGLYINTVSGISTTGTGSISIDGTGGTSTGMENHGVYTIQSNSITSSGGGDITVTGTAGANSTNAYDVYLISNGSVSGTSTGSDIAFECTSEGLNPFNYNTDVSTGSSNTISFVSGSKINFEIDGPSVNSQYRQLHIDGQINLTGSTPTFNGSNYTPTTGNSFMLIDNDGTDAVIGTFTGLPQGATLTNFLGSGLDATISYIGGDGNDVTIDMPADYQIDLVGGNVTITDLSGNSDYLYLQQVGTNLRFACSNSSRTYRINSGSNTYFSTPAEIPFTSVTNSITVNSEDGNDAVLVYAFTQQLPSLTINGGVGNDFVRFQGDVTFVAGANLDVDLQDDDANPGIDYVQLLSSVDVLLQGSGSATIKASRDIYLNSYATLRTANGDITLEANQQSTPTTGYYFSGVTLDDYSVVESTGTGTVTVKGRGGNLANLYNMANGVYVQANAKIIGGTTGNGVSVEGTGGSATSYVNYGVYLESGQITSNGGNVSVDGVGGENVTNNSYGVYVLSTNAAISAGNDGNVTVEGTGGGAAHYNYGVHVTGGNARITTDGDGDVSVIGTGGGGATHIRNYGVYIYTDSGISSTGAGSISVEGTGGIGSGTENHGVYLYFNNSVTSSGGGDITVTGTAGANSSSAFDVYLVGNGSVTGTSTGSDITFDCTSEGLNPFNYNTDVSTGSGNTISFVNGSKTNFEIDGPTANSQHRQLHIDGQINLTGSTPTFNGSNYTPVVGNSFTLIDNDGTDAVVGTFTGLPQGATLTNFLGSGLDATISYVGGDGNDVVINMAVDYQIDVVGGNVTITDLSGNSDYLYVQQNGTNLRFTCSNNSRTYRINNGSNTLFSTAADIPFTSVTNSITVNAEDGNDAVYVYPFTQQLPSLTINGGVGNDFVYFQGDVTFASGANLDVDLQNDDANPGIDYVYLNSGADVLLQGSGSATLKMSREFILGSNSTLRTENGNLTIEANQQTTPTIGYYFSGIQLGTGSIIECTGTGDVSVKGRGGNYSNSTYHADGVYLFPNAMIVGGTSGTSTIVEGFGGSATSYFNYGVFLDRSQISSNGGNVAVTGTGGSPIVSNSVGVYLYGTDASISAGGNGDVNVVGNGGGTGNANYGVRITSANIGVTGNGDVSVSGTGGGTTGSSNFGVVISSNSGISSSGTGTVTVDGNGGSASGTNNHGVYLETANSITSSGGGDIIVSGVAGSNSSLSYDVFLATNGSISSTSVFSDIIFDCPSGGLNPFNYGSDVTTGSNNTISFVSGSKINFEIDGTAANSAYRQLHIDGKINLNGCSPSFNGSNYTPVLGNSFIIVDNDGTDAVIGTFTGLPEGAFINNFLGTTLSAQVTYVGGDGNDVVLNVMLPFIYWTGAVNTNWNLAGNWSSNSVPGASNDVIIPDVANQPVISTNQQINDIELEPGATLNVASGGTLTLNGDLDNSATVTIESGGSFLQGNSSSISNVGIFRVQRQGSTSYYNMWSSPITSQTGIPGTSYQYSSSASTQDDSDDQPSDPGWSSYNGAMTPGRGYAGQGGNLATFTGTPNNGNVNFGLYYAPFDNTFTQTVPGTPFNLIGNPYPSAISAASFISANTDIDGTIYLWNDNGSNNYSRTDYAYWNGTGGLGTGGGPTPNGYIGSCQGFMVRALNGSAVANFTNNMRVAGNNSQFHKPGSDDSRMWLSLENADVRNEILIGLLEDATEGEDRMYDAVKLKGNPDIALSAIDAATEYAILAFPPPLSTRTVPLKLKLSTAGNYYFVANTMENFEGHEVYLSDTRTGTNVLLNEGDSVPVNLAAGEHNDRFFLNFVPTSFTGIDENEEANITAFVANERLNVKCEFCTSEDALELMDMSGRRVMAFENAPFANGSLSIPVDALTTGVYVVRVINDTKAYSQKIIKH